MHRWVPPWALSEGLRSDDAPDEGLLELDRALEALGEMDERKARVVEMVFFTGLTQLEVADVLDVSVSPVERELRAARAWLAHRLRS